MLLRLRPHLLLWTAWTVLLMCPGTLVHAQEETVQINEFMPWPVGVNEWVELFHAGSGTLNLAGWSIDNGTSAAPTIISSSSVLAGDPSSFEPGTLLVVRLDSNILVNAGGTVRLRNSSGAIISSISYGSATPNRTHARLYDGSPDWQANVLPTQGTANGPLPPSATPTITPATTPTASELPAQTATATASPLPAAHPILLINEVLAHPSSGPGWIEFYNPGSTAIDVTDWMLRVNVGTPGATQRRLNGSVPPGGFLVYSSDFLPDTESDLNLFDAHGHAVHAVVYPSLAIDQVYARAEDGGSAWRADYPPSPGAPNRPATPTPTFTETATPSNTPTEPTATGTPTATPTPRQQTLWLNELLAAPASGANEWVELYNPSASAVVLTGWHLRRTSSGGTVVQKSLPELTIAPDGFVVYETASGLLPNSGGTLTLLDAQGRTIDSLRYPALDTSQVYARAEDGSSAWRADYPPSPGAPNRPHLLSETATPSPASTITTSPTASPHTPAATPHPTAAGTSSAGLVIINELLAAPAPGQAEWIELYNPGTTALHIKNWRLQRTSSGGTVRQQTIAAITVPPGGFAVYSFSSSFLPNDGATLRLFAESGALVGEVLSYPALQTGQSYARTTDGAAGWRKDYPLSPGRPNLPPSATATASATPSATPSRTPTASATSTPSRTATAASSKSSAKTGSSPRHTATATATATPSDQQPLLLIINEVLAAPSAGEAEWIELYNLSDTTVNITGWTVQRTSSGGTVGQRSLPELTIAPYGFAVYEVASGFLPNAGATLLLLDAQANQVGDAVRYPQMQKEQGYARLPDGSATWCEHCPRTPGAPNQPPISPTETPAAQERDEHTVVVVVATASGDDTGDSSASVGEETAAWQPDEQTNGTDSTAPIVSADTAAVLPVDTTLQPPAVVSAPLAGVVRVQQPGSLWPGALTPVAGYHGHSGRLYTYRLPDAATPETGAPAALPTSAQAQTALPEPAGPALEEQEWLDVELLAGLLLLALACGCLFIGRRYIGQDML